MTGRSILGGECLAIVLRCAPMAEKLLCRLRVPQSITSHLKAGVKNAEGHRPYFALRIRPVIDRHPVEAAVHAVTQVVKDFSMLVGESSA
jgi:hypothetical protein